MEAVKSHSLGQPCTLQCCGEFRPCVASLCEGGRVLHRNSQRLVSEMETLPLLDGRFRDMELVNISNGEKRGFFSLVFKAYDEIENKYVALKFFDQDPSKMTVHRLACFEREHQLLEGLVGIPRCLQLLSPMGVLEFDVGTDDLPFISRAKYFVTEWLDKDIDEYFLRQDIARSVEKLKIFNETVLAIEALHNREICHRDVKVDNFRHRRGVPAETAVVAIDLGAAAMNASPQLKARYADPVGFTTYAAPETFCGLAGDRRVAVLTDVYALGCMLFELFAEDDYWTAYSALNPDFEARIGALRHVLANAPSVEEVERQWDLHAPKLLSGLAPIEFPRSGTSVPLAVVDLINGLMADMTKPNFRRRAVTLEQVRRRLWSAIRCLENERLARLRAQRVAEQRASKRQKSARRGAAAIGSIPNCQIGV